MEHIRVMLCCGAGMSSGFLAQKTRAAAKKKDISMQIDARSESQVPQYLNSIDVLLIGPHYASQLSSYEELTKGKGIKLAVIPKAIYGTLDGAALLAFILELIAS